MKSGAAEWSERADWYDLKVVGDPEGRENFYINAVLKDSGEEIGYVEVKTRTSWKDAIVVVTALVQEEYRRRGVATALYDHAARVTGKSILPYSYYSADEPMSDDAKAFWLARNPDVSLDD